MKYIIDLPEEFAEATKEYWDKTVGMQLEPYTESDIYSHTDNPTGWELYQDYQKAKEKYETWKKQKDQICVGDEVIYRRNKYIVGYVGEDEVYHLVDQCWLRVVVQGDYQLIKTGRHFNEVEELLKKIKEV